MFFPFWIWQDSPESVRKLIVSSWTCRGHCVLKKNRREWFYWHHWRLHWL